jgi:hypothetical protein
LGLVNDYLLLHWKDIDVIIRMYLIGQIQKLTYYVCLFGVLNRFRFTISGDAKQDQVKQSKAKQGKAKQSKAGQSKVR